MIDSLKTEEGERADLAAIEVNPPIGYIGHLLLPTMPIKAKAGVMNYAIVESDSAAQTGRNLGSAPSGTVIGEQTVNISVAEYIKRYLVPYSTVPLMGGVAGSDNIGAKASKRSVQNAIETLQIAEVIDAEGTDITSGIVDGLIAAADAVKRYSGDLAFVCSVGTYRWLVQQDEIKNLLLRTMQGLTAAQAMSLNVETFKQALQGLFMFKEVLVFDDDFVPAAYTYTAAVIKLPSADEFSFAMQPEYGRTAMYIPDDSQFEVNSYPSDDLRSNVYDATSWMDILEFNSGAKSLVTLSNATLTTTT
jgi:hypothetical protein